MRFHNKGGNKTLAHVLFIVSAFFIAYLYALYPLSGVDSLVFSVGSISLITHYFWMFFHVFKFSRKKTLWIILFVFLFFIASFIYHIFVFRKYYSDDVAGM